MLLSYRSGATEDIWLHDITRQVTEPFAAEPVSEWISLWTADGERVLFTSRRSGPFQVYGKRANGLGGVERVSNISSPFGLTPDGTALLFQDAGRMSTGSIADATTTVLWTDEYRITDARLSPDGRWIAYCAGPTQAQEQIWVRPYPDVQSNRWRVSSDGGRSPRWSADSRTIFYRRGADMMASNVGSGPGRRARSARAPVRRSVSGRF